ncbi:hypothetical protein A0257_02620 [Hymenobacter psoromatis]|nr:hypothetical protein A0257_02620 [Hymenobacter psoromatis]
MLTGLPVALVCGDQDEYVSPAKLQEQMDILRRHGADVHTHGFAGGHMLHPGLLRQLHATPLFT